MAEIEVKNKFQVGDKLEIIHPKGNAIIELTAMTTLDGTPTTTALGSGHHVKIPLQSDMTGGMLARFM